MLKINSFFHWDGFVHKVYKDYIVGRLHVRNIQHETEVHGTHSYKKQFKMKIHLFILSI